MTVAAAIGRIEQVTVIAGGRRRAGHRGHRGCWPTAIEGACSNPMSRYGKGQGQGLQADKH